MKHSLFFTFCLMAILPACAQKISIPLTATAAPTAVSPFNYDAAVPFDTQIVSQSEQEGVTVTELNYAAHDPSFSQYFGGRTVAILVSPKGKGPFAGIVYMHWFGDLTGGRAGVNDRHEYLTEAVTMAQHGAVCLLPQGYFPWVQEPTYSVADRPLIIDQVIELRRAFDFLLTQPGVDPKRLGYLGHDLGGSYGGILAGVDKRPKAFVLIAGAPSLADTPAFAGWEAGNPNQTYGLDLDPVNFVPKAAPASLFFQFGKRDGFVAESLAKQYYEAASQPKQIEGYDDIHAMDSDAVREAHQAWLIEQLKLAP